MVKLYVGEIRCDAPEPIINAYIMAKCKMRIIVPLMDVVVNICRAWLGTFVRHGREHLSGMVGNICQAWLGTFVWW